MTPSTRIARRMTAVAAFCCSAALVTAVTACGAASPSGTSGKSGGTSAAGHAGTVGTASTRSPGSTGSPATPAAGSSPSADTPGTATAAPAAAACLSRYLRAEPGAAQGTAGSVYVQIDFTNLDNQPCTLYGYPGVSLAAGTPVKQVGLAATENPDPQRELVTLNPRGTAAALLQIADAGNYSAAQCRPMGTSWLQVYPPGQTVPLYVHYSTTGCAGPVHLLTVSVVQPGSGSSS